MAFGIKEVFGQSIACFWFAEQGADYLFLQLWCLLLVWDELQKVLIADSGISICSWVWGDFTLNCLLPCCVDFPVFWAIILLWFSRMPEPIHSGLSKEAILLTQVISLADHLHLPFLRTFGFLSCLGLWISFAIVFRLPFIIILKELRFLRFEGNCGIASAWIKIWCLFIYKLPKWLGYFSFCVWNRRLCWYLLRPLDRLSCILDELEVHDPLLSIGFRDFTNFQESWVPFLEIGLALVEMLLLKIVLPVDMATFCACFGISAITKKIY